VTKCTKFIRSEPTSHHISKMACQQLSQMSHEDIKTFFGSFDTVLSDCDGVLWQGPDAIPGSPEMIHKFRDMGKKVIYVTNNATKSRKEYVTKCTDLGFGGVYEEIYTPSFLVTSYLKGINFDDKKKVYLFGSSGIANELSDAGIKFIGLGPDPMPEVLPVTERFPRLSASRD
jgi:phosphoglycolate phosphatase